MATDKLNPVIIETARLQLREINPETFQYLFSFATDEEIMAYLGIASLVDLETERKKFEKGMTTFNRSFKYFQMIDKSIRKIIGWCGYHTWMTDHARAEIGYQIYDQNLWGKGYMKEVIKPVVAFGFDEMNLHRVEACIGPMNEASLKLIKGLGFTEEGYMRQHYFKNQKFEDSIIFSLLRNEYDQLKKSW